jgi:hypothetical protein
MHAVVAGDDKRRDPDRPQMLGRAEHRPIGSARKYSRQDDMRSMKRSVGSAMKRSRLDGLAWMWWAAAR